MLGDFLLGIITLTILSSALCLPTIDPTLRRTLDGGKTANILISFKEGTKKALRSVSRDSSAGRFQRIAKLADTLRLNAELSQGDLLRFLESQNINLVKQLISFDEVAEITEDELLKLDEPVGCSDAYAIPGRKDDELEWNIRSIDAPSAWDAGFSGRGVVVANIDTGVRVTHKALRGNYIGGTHGWYDPYTESLRPTDENGHGTHAMGILAGSGGIGVAPGASWMACKGCFHDICSPAHLIKCGQFLLCPTRANFTEPDCGKAPHVISCSWGGGRNNQQFHPVIDAWTAAGIISVFSNGNTGPQCATARSPADYPHVIGVGAIKADGEVEGYSGLGPTLNGTIKPDFVSFGTGILSSYNSGDDEYSVLKGTSMAACHVGGVITILLSLDIDLNFEEVKYHLRQAANKNLTLPGMDCGGVDELQFPNNAVGYGAVNAYKSLQSLINEKNI